MNDASANKSRPGHRIWIVSPTFLPTIGGTENLISQLSRRLVTRGHQVTVLTRTSKRVPSLENLAGVQIRRLRLPNHSLSIIPFQIWLLWMLVKYRDHYDLVHQFHLYHAGGALVCARFLTRKPLVTTLIGWDTHDALRPLPHLFNPYLAWIMNQSDRLTAISSDLARHAVKQGCRKPIEVQQLGTDLVRFHPSVDGSTCRKRLGLTDSEVLVFALQRLDYRKKLEVLLEAFAIASKSASNLHLLIGGTGPEDARLQSLARELDISTHVGFAGFIEEEELPLFYAACDLFVLHSTYEGFGLVLTDAMASGKPVIATRVGAIPEVVTDGHSGILVPPCQPAALAASLLDLSGSERTRIEMGLNARQEAERRFDWSSVAARISSTYRAILPRP